MGERWHSGIYLGKKAGTEENLVMTMSGSVVRARAVREVHRRLCLQDLEVLSGTPHDPAGVLRPAGRDEGRHEDLAAEERGDFDAGPTPKRVQITKEVVSKFGPTPGCVKCRGVMAGDKSYQYVHHNHECRTRMESLMRQDEKLSKVLEAAEERQVRRIAELLEKRDKEAKAKEKDQLEKDERAKETMRKRGKSPGGQEEARSPGTGSSGGGGGPSNSNLQGQASQAGTKRRAEEQATPEEGDDDLDMGIPLATEQASSSSRKREIPQEGEPAAPAATRPRLEMWRYMISSNSM